MACNPTGTRIWMVEVWGQQDTRPYGREPYSIENKTASQFRTYLKSRSLDPIVRRFLRSIRKDSPCKVLQWLRHKHVSQDIASLCYRIAWDQAYTDSSFSTTRYNRYFEQLNAMILAAFAR